MNAPEGLDIRAPIGGLFTVLGGLLAGYGLFASASSGSPALSVGENVNLWWGLVMFAFGILLLLMVRRSVVAGARAASEPDARPVTVPATQPEARSPDRRVLPEQRESESPRVP
jgi:hypothetical protein